ncbi:hypothetical protein DFH11DRAFT_1636448 [Phellopilus nigrolimitatus]|nr:hypothetical protein DFH11DRAFT_1636448 [Phellopilus nigrolimitatus]
MWRPNLDLAPGHRFNHIPSHIPTAITGRALSRFNPSSLSHPLQQLETPSISLRFATRPSVQDSYSTLHKFCLPRTMDHLLDITEAQNNDCSPSSIQLLPPEISGRIFSMVIANAREKCDRLPRSNLLELENLASVCRSWREMIRGYSSIWSTIKATLPLDDSTTSPQRFPPTFFKRHIENSRDAPLEMDIAVVVSGTPSRPRIPAFENAFLGRLRYNTDGSWYMGTCLRTAFNYCAFDQLLLAIAQQQHRLKSARLEIVDHRPYRVEYESSDVTLNLENTPLLENLELQLQDDFGLGAEPQNKAVVNLSGAPNLKVVHISGNIGILPPNSVRNTLTVLNLMKGNELELRKDARLGRSSFTMAECFEIIKFAPALQLLHAVLRDPNFSASRLEPFRHESLASLHLLYDEPGAPYIPLLIDCLTLPSLKRLAVGTIGIRDTNMDICHVPGLLSRSLASGAHVTHLNFYCINLSEVRQCLTLVQDLETLEIFGRYDPDPEFDSDDEDNWEEYSSVIRDLTLRDSAAQLCPMLQAISLRYMDWYSEDLVALVVSRCSPPFGPKRLTEMLFEGRSYSVTCLMKDPRIQECIAHGLTFYDPELRNREATDDVQI